MKVVSDDNIRRKSNINDGSSNQGSDCYQLRGMIQSNVIDSDNSKNLNDEITSIECQSSKKDESGQQSSENTKVIKFIDSSVPLIVSEISQNNIRCGKIMEPEARVLSEKIAESLVDLPIFVDQVDTFDKSYSDSPDSTPLKSSELPCDQQHEKYMPVETNQQQNRNKDCGNPTVQPHQPFEALEHEKIVCNSSSTNEDTTSPVHEEQTIPVDETRLHQNETLNLSQHPCTDDYSTFAWTKATKHFFSDSTIPGKSRSRYSSAPSSSSIALFSSLSNKKEAAMLMEPRRDFFLSTESSKLLASGKIKHPEFFWSPQAPDVADASAHNQFVNQQASTSSFGYIRLDAYSNHAIAVAQSKVASASAGTSLATFANSQQFYGTMQGRVLQRYQLQQHNALKQRIRYSAAIGALMGGMFAILVLFVFPHFSDNLLDFWNEFVQDHQHIQNKLSFQQSCCTSTAKTDCGLASQSTLPKQTHHLAQSHIDCHQQYIDLGHSPTNWISSYLDVLLSFRWFQEIQNESKQSDNMEGGHNDNLQRNRRIRSLSNDSPSSTIPTRKSSSLNGNSPLLVIAGKMTVEGGPCNIAQYNLKTGEWSLEERIQLSLYNSYSGGEVYSLLANYSTSTSAGNNSSGDDDATSRTSHLTGTTTKRQVGSGDLIVVGAFDTTYRNSQVTYCSVGVWDGSQLSKVGEGLCNSALSKGMKITTASLAGPQDVYVAGSFQTQVWNGDRNEFVKIFNIAHFNAVNQVWLPLNVGQISCSWCTVTVLALAWDSKRRQLHVAGKFNAIDGQNVPAGLAVYDYDSGHLVAHPGGGLCMLNISQDGVGTALQLDEDSGVLYVMGSFERLTQTYERCDGLAAYEIEANRWTCLADAAHTVYPTGGGNMLLTPYGLMVAGKTTPSTTWRNPARPYTIALLKATLKTWNKNQPDLSNENLNSSTFRRRSSNFFSNNEGNILGNDNPSNSTNTTISVEANDATNTSDQSDEQFHYFNWSWLPGFKGHDEPLHALTNGFGSYEGSVFIAGDNLVARWSYQPTGKFDSDDDADDESTVPPILQLNLSNDDRNQSANLNTESEVSERLNEESWDQVQLQEGNGEDTLVENDGRYVRRLTLDTRYSSGGIIATPQTPRLVPVTELLSMENVRGAIMAISQMMPVVPEDEDDTESSETGGASGSTYNSVNITIIVYCVTVGCIIGVIGAILCNRNVSGPLLSFRNKEKDFKGFSLDTLTYSAVENTGIMEAYQRAMKTRYVHHPNLLTIIDPQEIFLQRIIGEGTFGRVWSARWRTASVAVKEFVFAQAAVAGKSSQQQQIVEEIIGEAGMMAILRHPNVLQLFGCSLTAQAIWIVSELCSLGSLRQLLDDNDRVLPVGLRLSLALQVAEGMTYLHNQVPPIIHRDLKSHNIFVHETFTDSSQQDDTKSTSSHKRKDGSERIESHSTIVARIGDWGSARASLSGSRTMTHGVGTACWLAPEVIKHARSSKFSDVYGYGIVLWELATREEVYQGLETTQIIAKVANENLRPPVPKDCPWKDLMVKCWAENPLDRLEFHEIDAELNDLSKRLHESQSSNGLSTTPASSVSRGSTAAGSNATVT